MELIIESYMESIINSYYENNAKKLHVMVDKVLRNLHFNDVDKEEFYSFATEIFVVEVIPNYNPEKLFEPFLYSTLYKKFCTRMTRDTRFKRCKKIKIEEKDEKGNTFINTVIVPDERLNAPISDKDDSTLEDIVSCNKTVESEIFGEQEEGYSTKMLLYLNRLSNLQKEVLQLTIAGYSPNEIKKELHITDKQYSDCNTAIHSYRNVSILM